MINLEQLLKKYMTVVLDVMQSDLIYKLDGKYQLSDGRNIKFSEAEEGVLLAIRDKIIDEEIDAMRG